MLLEAYDDTKKFSEALYSLFGLSKPVALPCKSQARKEGLLPAKDRDGVYGRCELVSVASGGV